MKRLPLTLALIVLLVGGLVTRECIIGSLKQSEISYSGWLEDAVIPAAVPKITLVTAETPGLLTALDVSLFLRAATTLHADVAAIAAYEFANDDASLLASLLNRERSTAVVGAALLTDFPGGIANFQTVDWKNSESLPRFVGVRNHLPSDPHTTFGFLNLPENGNAQSISLLSRWNDRVVTSFSLACLTRFMEVNGVKPVASKNDDELAFSNQRRLTLARNGTLRLFPETYMQIVQLSLGDLLVAAEKAEQPVPLPDPAVEAIRNRLVILAASPSNEEISAGTFTIGQFQALCVASTANQFHRLSLGIWIWWIPFVWFFPWLKLSESWGLPNQIAGMIMVATLYQLLAVALAKGWGILLPGIPALGWFLAIVGVMIYRHKVSFDEVRTQG